MKLTFAVFVLALLTMAATSVGFAVWDGHVAHRDPLRPVHYDMSIDRGAAGSSLPD
jgi:hypothetical protein